MNKGILKNLCCITGVSGYEREIVDTFIDTLKDYVTDWDTDVMGNGFVFLGDRVQRFRVMVEAHADEIGMQVLYIDDSGYVYFRPNGGIDEQCMPGTQVIITNVCGDKIDGVIGKKPIHLMNPEERKMVFKLNQLWIDTGLDSSIVKEKISVGDAISVKPNLTWLGANRVTGKSLDNRIGLFTVIEVIKCLSTTNIRGIVGVATSQEEVGCRGALVAANTLNPEISITVDVDFATDVPDCRPCHYGNVSLGMGVVIQRNLDCDVELCVELEKLAKRRCIPYQISTRKSASGGNNASRIQLVRQGIRTISLGIPCRYMHTPVEVCDLRDVEAAVRLICEFCKINSN